MDDTWQRMTLALLLGGVKPPSKMTVTRVPATKRVRPSTSTPVFEMFTSSTASPVERRTPLDRRHRRRGIAWIEAGIDGGHGRLAHREISGEAASVLDVTLGR